jgi:hypothetical protein
MSLQSNRNRFSRFITRLCIGSLLLSAAASPGEINVAMEHNDEASATPAFTFKKIPAASMNDAGTKAEFVVVDGAQDRDRIASLNDGKLPAEEDAPEQNFFFIAGTDGGRLLVDLRNTTRLKQVNTYSWHPNSRGPQVYELYASDGQSTKFKAQPSRGVEPEKCGWRLIAKVDTRKKYGMDGGQYGVSISDSDGTIGKYRYLLFVMSRTEKEDDFGNTFYSEIDVVDGDAPEPPRPITPATAPSDLSRTFASGGGAYQIKIDPSGAPDLADWAFKHLAPVMQEWYPKIVKLLPSEGFEPPTKLTIDFANSSAGYVAITRGSHVTCSAGWFRDNLEGEATGSVVHELVHVVQHYGGRRRAGASGASPRPSWLTEGIPDYIRWFIYEPQSHGADVVWMRRQRNPNPSYDGGYRVSANFLNWATQNYSTNLVEQLNVALREGRYKESLWKEITGHEMDELGGEWKKWLSAELGRPSQLKD